MKIMSSVCAVVLFLGANLAVAETFKAQARVYAGGVNANPSIINTEMTAIGLKEIKTVVKYGAEITMPILGFFDGGLRYEKKTASAGELVQTATSDNGTLDQDTFYFIGRVPIVKSALLHFDVFGGIGGSNTSFKLKTSSQDGEYSRREGKDWYASLATIAGASVAVGMKGVYFVVEAGMESNKVNDFKRTGTLTSNVTEADLSGPYATIGIMFDGVNATK